MGGPQDIVSNCSNGILFNPESTKEMAQAIKKFITDRELWQECSKNGINGVQNHYIWDAHAKKYIYQVKNIHHKHTSSTFSKSDSSGKIGKRLTKLDKLFITDIDDTLLGNDEALEKLMNILKKHNDTIGFGLASGRSLDKIKEVIKKHNLCTPDIIISSVGAEIYYGTDAIYDKGWDTHLSSKWNIDKIKTICSKFPNLELQEEETQRKYKVSYYLEDESLISDIHYALMNAKCKYNMIYSGKQFLDILPFRASKGKAIRYLSYKWNISLDHILVSGDSGNDEEMLRGDTLGVVVGNYHKELEKLKGLRNIYFSSHNYSEGILDGINKYNFLTS